jgi:hypothetical protein
MTEEFDGSNDAAKAATDTDEGMATEISLELVVEATPVVVLVVLD